ncbi:MAG: hypothetical protein R6U17_06785 [Thermoplasmata archaeon]
MYMFVGVRKTVISIVAFSLIISTLFLPGCIEDQDPQEENEIKPLDDPVEPFRGYYLGTLPMPEEGQTFDESYNFFSVHGEFTPVWGKPTPFYKMAEDLEGNWGQTYVDNYIRGNEMFPLIHLSFIGQGMSLESPANIQNPSLKDNEWREAYKEAAIDVVKTSKPLYLSLGNEVNRWYEKYGAEDGDEDGFQHYVSLYEETYDAVKEVSPETKVFCVFAREIVSENIGANFDFISMFDRNKLDMLMITSYPHSVQGINRPSDIPEDYYSSVAGLLPNKPFGFSEIAWPSSEVFGGESAQAHILREVTGNLTLDHDVDLQMLTWSWLHDLNEQDDTGMIERNGTEKQIFQVWKELS